MRRGFLTSLGLQRQATALLTLFALILPLLLALAPQRALSAEEAAIREFAGSICGPSNQASPSGGGHPGDHQQCLFCLAGCATGCAAPSADRIGETLAIAHQAGFHFPCIVAGSAIHAILKDGNPPRGPPSATLPA
jgi:hypothetical protein